MNFDIDIAIFVGFLVANLALGLNSSKGIRTLKEYAIGDRNFSTATIVSTIIATCVSGEYFFTIASETYNSGLYFIWSSAIGDCVCFALIAFVFAPRMAEFLGKLSIADAMGSLYGDKVRVITAIAGFVGVAGIISMQLKAAGIIFEYALGMPSAFGTIIAGMLITIYSALGGIKSVTFTDIIQFITFGVVIPVILYFLLGSINNIDVVTNIFTTNPSFDYKQVFDFTEQKPLYFLFFFIFNAIPAFNPASFQRISMAKSTAQARKSFGIATLVFGIMGLVVPWIGILTIAIHPDIAPNDVIKTIILDSSYIFGFKGLICVGIMAMIMSTVDSYINSASVIVVHDFFEPLKIRLFNNQLFLARVVSFLIGFFAIMLSLRNSSLLELLILTYSFYMPIVTVPFIMAIFGFRTSEKSVLLAMAAGISTVVVWNYVLQIKVLDSVPFALLANLIVLVGSHYLLKQEGGWVGIKDPTPLIENRQKRKLAFDNFCNVIRNFSLIKTLNQNSTKADGFISIMGLFVMISSFASVNSLPHEVKQQYAYILDILYPITLCSSSALMSYPLWLPAWQNSNLRPIVWNIIIFYVFVCFGFLMVLVSDFSSMQLIVFMINILMVCLLFRWKWALFNIIVGVGIVTFCYKSYIAVDVTDNSFVISEFKIVYLLVLISSSLVILLKPKQEYIEATERKVGSLETEVTHLDHEVTNLHEQVVHYSERTKNQEQEIERLGKTAQRILNNVNHELRLPIGNVVNFSDMLWEALEKSDNKLLQELSKEVYKNSNRVSSMILNMLDLATLDVKKVDLKKETINFSKLVEERVQTCRKIYLGNKKIDFDLKIQPDVMISVDPNYMRQTVDNLVINAISFSETGLIKVVVSKQKGQVIFTITDQGKGIPPAELSDIFTPFKMGSNTESKADGRGIGLALCKSAVEAHGGTIIAESDGKVGATLKFELPS